LFGTPSGGVGETPFGPPDLRGRAPVHQGLLDGVDFTMGQSGGVEEVALASAQLPAHAHALMPASAPPATTTSPAGNLLAAATEAVVMPYGTAEPQVALEQRAVT